MTENSGNDVPREAPAKILWGMRYLLARRMTQIGILFLFSGALLWDWRVLRGNLSASWLFEAIPLADPFAVLQIFFAGQSLEGDVLWGVLIVILFYALVGGRVFCSWVCPMNMVTDLAAWTRRKLNIRSAYQLNRSLRWVAMFTALVLSALTGVAAFEWISPVSGLHRELVFGLGIGWTAVFGIFLFDLLLVRHGWCGHLCPLGAFYSLLGVFRLPRIRFDADSCDQCGQCHRICPEPHVLNLSELRAAGRVNSRDCTNCLRCTTLCPQDSLALGLVNPLPDLQQIETKEVS